MNSRIRKKYRANLICPHLYTDSQLLTTDPIPYYQYEEYCKIKDADDLEINHGIFNDYQDNYCLRCRHFHPSCKQIRETERYNKLMNDLTNFENIILSNND